MTFLTYFPTFSESRHGPYIVRHYLSSSSILSSHESCNSLMSCMRNVLGFYLSTASPPTSSDTIDEEEGPLLVWMEGDPRLNRATEKQIVLHWSHGTQWRPFFETFSHVPQSTRKKERRRWYLVPNSTSETVRLPDLRTLLVWWKRPNFNCTLCVLFVHNKIRWFRPWQSTTLCWTGFDWLQKNLLFFKIDLEFPTLSQFVSFIAPTRSVSYCTPFLGLHTPPSLTRSTFVEP